MIYYRKKEVIIMSKRNFNFIAFLTLCLFLLFNWPHYFLKIESHGSLPSIESSAWMSLTKYQLFISSLKQSGQSGRLFLPKFSIVEADRVRLILDLELSEGETPVSNKEAKTLFFQTLALPLQSVCQ